MKSTDTAQICILAHGNLTNGPLATAAVIKCAGSERNKAHTKLINFQAIYLIP